MIVRAQVKRVFAVMTGIQGRHGRESRDFERKAVIASGAASPLVDGDQLP